MIENGERGTGMDVKIRKKEARALFVLALISAAGGFVNGLLGAGGGILFVFALSRLQKDDPKDAFASTIAVILPISAISAYIYVSKGTPIPDNLPIFILPAMAGGILGAFLLDKIKLTLLKKIFAALIVYSGVNMILK